MKTLKKVKWARGKKGKRERPTKKLGERWKSRKEKKKSSPLSNVQEPGPLEE